MTKGQRPSTEIFVYTNPKSREEKIHNKQARALIAVKKSEKTIEQQAIGSLISHHINSKLIF
ncbi:hypothetical protein SAMN04488128_105494 [Chitinophaga eiseniae]|uniref:Uncharacterized protein n=1 Tax=Chitinophaga eiseniae TaxID=634771 RepID=A0A1T4TMT4_9BACT|nr:hypothetical protein SAMN04488128_105494 [Chitinophaga eiseniae]